MAQHKEPVPGPDVGFDRRFKLITQVCAQKTGGSPPAWTHIPQAKLQELITAYGQWYTAYAPTLTPHGGVETEEKNRVRRLTEPVLRRFIQRFLYVEEVTTTELESMELPLRDTERTAHGVPEEHVVLDVKPHAPRELTIDFTCEETGKRSRPDETYKGMVLYLYQVEEGETPPSADMFERSKLLTRSPHIETFPLDQRGKQLLLSGCWENSRGQEGPRCPPVLAVIP
ncbi:MAG: hypothetical protein LBD31_05935 [Treponema sp.]|jgi:hypothetical protein|nr:hypothetical protein [Treponema sp.]